MCSNENSPTAAATTVSAPSAILPFGLKSLSSDQPTTAAVYATSSMHPASVTQAALEHYRLQLYNYAYSDRFRTYTNSQLSASPFAMAAAAAVGFGPTGHPHHQLTDAAAAAAAAYSFGTYGRYEPGRYRIPEEPKPQHSYIGLIGMAILGSPDKKLVLSDIYQYILDNYPYFRARGPGWRNSIRHNLSLNDCFIKAGRSANGKGHYWAIHPANIEDFKRGDFRRRKAQRKVRKHMGLSVPDDEDSPSPPPSPRLADSVALLRDSVAENSLLVNERTLNGECLSSSLLSGHHHHHHHLNSPFGLNLGRSHHHVPITGIRNNRNLTGLSLSHQTVVSRKRLFDVESLLAPDPEEKDSSSPGMDRNLRYGDDMPLNKSARSESKDDDVSDDNLISYNRTLYKRNKMETSSPSHKLSPNSNKGEFLTHHSIPDELVVKNLSNSGYWPSTLDAWQQAAKSFFVASSMKYWNIPSNNNNFPKYRGVLNPSPGNSHLLQHPPSSPVSYESPYHLERKSPMGSSSDSEGSFSPSSCIIEHGQHDLVGPTPGCTPASTGNPNSPTPNSGHDQEI